MSRIPIILAALLIAIPVTGGPADSGEVSLNQHAVKFCRARVLNVPRLLSPFAYGLPHDHADRVTPKVSNGCNLSVDFCHCCPVN